MIDPNCPACHGTGRYSTEPLMCVDGRKRCTALKCHCAGTEKVGTTELGALLRAIDECVRYQGEGFDVLASAEWDEVVRIRAMFQ